MWIVKLALRRPHTFLVMALAIILAGFYALLVTPTDIFPAIRIPVVSVIWRYTGLSPEDMSNRVVSFSERVATTTVNDIEHIESNSLNGMAVVKYFFQPSVNEDLAVAQITSISQTLLTQMPQGTTPPFILAYNASSVPVIQLAMSSALLSEAELFDLGNNFVRIPFSTIPGVSLPWPYGGKQRQVQVDIDPQKMRNFSMSASMVADAINRQNLIIPAGTQKIGDLEYFIQLNAAPEQIEALNNLPIKAVDGKIIYLRDVATVRDGYPPQTNIVRMGGHRAVLMNILKTGSASTLTIVDHLRALLPGIKAGLPASLRLELINDQSLFVRAAISGVVHEGLMAAFLTALMILLFLGNASSTMIITFSIPLSILSSIACLALLGETINLMTLGGLALAVGILVDDATVAIENINAHLEQGQSVHTAILEGAEQIAIPALVSTLCICIVFIPVTFLHGVAHFLFVPMAEAVVFAMLSSYILSRTLVPVLAHYWLRPHAEETVNSLPNQTASDNPALTYQQKFDVFFKRLRQRYQESLQQILRRDALFIIFFLVATAASLLLFPWLGEDFFPSVDTGHIQLHLRTRTGLRIEQTARRCDQVETFIRTLIPAGELDSLVDNIGLPYSGINLSYSTSSPIGPGDADIIISLKPHHAPTATYIAMLRQRLNRQFPETDFAFLPADIISQILDFGLPAPIDLQVAGYNLAADQTYAHQLLKAIQVIPGLTDARMQQRFDYPQIRVAVDRSRAMQLHLDESDVAHDLLVTLSGSFQTSPTFWLDPKSRVQYSITTQAPEYRMQHLDDLYNLPVSDASGHWQPLANLASFHRGFAPAVISHYDAKPVIDLYASPWQRDLGGVTQDVQKVLQQLPPPSKAISVTLRGQVTTMQAAFKELAFGLVAAIVLVYLLIVVNFQSWIDPWIIIAALPAALAGMVWMLFLTHTTLSVPALTGAIMCVGVATANSILVISFAREQVQQGLAPGEAVLLAATSRLRPVLMTALAMIIGMIPMAAGMGEGGEQNAPLGRAVIGGLLAATVATLYLVPCLYQWVHTSLFHSSDR